MMPQPPSGQGPVDPRGAFAPPPPPPGVAGAPPGWAPPPPGYPPQMPPMMMMPPPPMFYPPPQKRGGFARALFVTLALIIFSISIIANVYLLMLTGLTSLAGADPGTRVTVLETGDATQKIAVIPIDGIIDSAAYDRFDKIIKQIEEDGNVKAVVIEVDTPGGTVTGSDQMYNRILKLKKDKGVPVVTSMGAMATSGGYYVACASDEIFVQPTTLTGNIGVVMQRFNFSGAMEKLGVQDTSVTPQGATFKNIESPFRPESPQAAAYLRALADDSYGRFKQIVSTGRKGKLTDTIEKIADGRVFTAAEALKLGLADHTGYPADAYARAATLASLGNETIVRYQHQPSFFDAFGVRSGLASKGGVQISVDPSVLRELEAPRAMYIWRGE